MKTKYMSKLITAGITTTTVAAATLSSMAMALDFKHVAVAPENMATQKLQAAQEKGLFSHSTMLPVRVADVKASSFEQKVYLDGPMDSPIVLLSPEAGDWLMTVTNPLGKVVYNERGAEKGLSVGQVKVGSQAFSGKQFQLKTPMAGEWTVKLTRKAGAPIKASKGRDILGYLLYKGDSSFQAYSYLDNNFTTVDSDLTLVAHMVDSTLDRGNRKAMVAKEALVGAIDRATASITTPSGKRIQLKLNDDGINGDKLAGDGLFSAKVPSDEVGVYTQQVQIRGVHANGKAFTRTTTDLYPIAEKAFEFTAKPASLKVTSGTSAVISVPVKRLADDKEVHLSAEVWGTDKAGNLKAATWVGGVVAASEGKGMTSLDLAVDTRWLARLGLEAPFALKSVRIQHVENNVPMAQADDIKLNAVSKIPAMKVADVKAIADDMRSIRVANKSAEKAATKGSGSKLLLVHGYCSGQAWLESHFSNADEFQDYNQSISHDTFARRIDSFGDQYNSYGIVAHSQGGAASLTLYSRYYSGLDNAGSGRLIQSVGTPYQGTALAGNLAAIGDVFGAGCGTNTDLTYNGASNWLATIPSWAKSKVYYYTTSFDTAWWRYDYCHLATDLFLDDPEDGTTEKWSGQLSGANNAGHKKGQCHTGGMRDPAQTKDTGRNSTMSNNAAR